MDIPKPSSDLYKLVAATADVCFKPWKHAVVDDGLLDKVYPQFNDQIELVIRIECRSIEGKRYPENDLDLEIYRSGTDLNLMISWCNQMELPMLWQGNHTVWMDASNGKRCQPPIDGESLESFARRLRALFTPQGD